jgi:hypothetical protein
MNGSQYIQISTCNVVGLLQIRQIRVVLAHMCWDTTTDQIGEWGIGELVLESCRLGCKGRVPHRPLQNILDLRSTNKRRKWSGRLSCLAAGIVIYALTFRSQPETTFNKRRPNAKTSNNTQQIQVHTHTAQEETSRSADPSAHTHSTRGDIHKIDHHQPLTGKYTNPDPQFQVCNSIFVFLAFVHSSTTPLERRYILKTYQNLLL